jgi:hypothetical protein
MSKAGNSALTGRTPARTKPCWFSPALSTTMALWHFAAVDAGAGLSSSIGRLAYGGLGWNEMVYSMTSTLFLNFPISTILDFYIVEVL